MSDAIGVGQAVLIAAGYGFVFAVSSRELLRALDPRVVMVSGLRLERPWLPAVRASLLARWFFLGTLIFDAVWLAGLVKQVLAKNMP